LSNHPAKTAPRSSRLALPLAAVLAAALALPARAADAPPKPDAGAEAAKADPAKPGGAGGDGGAKPKAASMVIEESSSSAELPPPPPQGEERNLIGEYVRNHTDEVRDCYQKRLQDRSTLQGKLIARFDIGPNGRVIGATADGIGDTLLVACVVAAVRKWEFEKPASGGKLRVAYPFVLKPEATR
jgi:outer membrane biosynthesis protein TonB